MIDGFNIREQIIPSASELSATIIVLPQSEQILLVKTFNSACHQQMGQVVTSVRPVALDLRASEWGSFENLIRICMPGYHGNWK